MFGPGWQGVFKDETNKVKRLALVKQLKPFLDGLNQAISDQQRDKAEGYALSLSQSIGQIAGFANSAAVCDQIVGLMNNISIALTAPRLNNRIHAMVRIENWQINNSAKVIQDWEAFKIMVFKGPRTVQ